MVGNVLVYSANAIEQLLNKKTNRTRNILKSSNSNIVVQGIWNQVGNTNAQFQQDEDRIVAGRPIGEEQLKSLSDVADAVPRLLSDLGIRDWKAATRDQLVTGLNGAGHFLCGAQSVGRPESQQPWQVSATEGTIENVSHVSTAMFPSPGVCNPTLTLVALAHWVAKQSVTDT
jgi:hypothetical protein